MIRLSTSCSRQAILSIRMPMIASSKTSVSHVQLRYPQLMRRMKSTITFPGRLSSDGAAATAVSSDAVVSNNHRPVAYWLLGMSGLVATMVSIGGITRLTRSGLSMTDWKLQGSLPPTTTEEWEVEFDRYKQFPEWQQRQSMTLNEFKFIYFWEYAHRMMGRFIGLAFTLPGLYFAARGFIPRHLYPRVGLLFTLGGGQGLIGWWMVKSGLEMDPQQRKEIRVSPYRLATHLSMAFTTYVLLVWTALDVLRSPQYMQQLAAELPRDALKHAKRFRAAAALNMLLAATTVLSGAFVAGNDAGNAFNTFPLMDDQWIPNGVLELQPQWRNFFENTATVQFDHRLLALLTLSGVTAMYAAARSTAAAMWQPLPAFTRTAFHLSMGMVATQVALGISTLLLYVPIELAAAHQAGSLVLMTFLAALTHSLGFAKHAAVAGRKIMSTPTSAATAAAVNSNVAAAIAAGGASSAVAKASTTSAAAITTAARAATISSNSKSNVAATAVPKWTAQKIASSSVFKPATRRGK